MDKKNLWKKALPYAVAFVVFVVLSALYFAPQFEGREIFMPDMVQYEGAAREIKESHALYDEDPQWVGTMFGGMPANTVSVTFPGQILKKTFTVLEFMGRPASLIFLAMLSFFVMLLLFRINPWVAIVPALAYGLSTYFFIIIAVGHVTKMASLAVAPLLVGGVFYTLRRNMWTGGALSAFFAALLIAGNHPQVAYYFMFIIVALWISELVRAVRKKLLPRFAKATGVLVIAAVLGIGANLAPFWYLNEYSKDSIRGGTELTVPEDSHARGGGLELEYATGWSYGIGETLNMYIPHLYGGSSEGNFTDNGPVADALGHYGGQARRMATQLPSYWGDQPVTSGPTYLGAVAIFLAVLALFMLPRRKTMWVVVVSLVAIMLAWGHNMMWFTRLFFYWFPGYDKFRTVAMILVIVEWTVPFFGALAISKLWRSRGEDNRMASVAPQGLGASVFHGVTREKLINSLKYTVFTLGGISLFFLLFGGMIYDFAAPADTRLGLPDDVLAAMRDERASMMRTDALRSLIFMLLAAGSVLLYAFRRIKRWALVALLGVLVCADLVAVNLRYLPQDKFVDKRRVEIRPTQADLQIKEDTEPGFRVLNMTVSPFNDATTSYFHRSIGGYSGAKMQRYQDIIDRYLSRGNQEVLNMLNTKYVIAADQQGGDPYPMVNPGANGAAWFVDKVSTVANADQEIAALESIDTKREAVVDQRFAQMLAGDAAPTDSTSYITLTEYRPNYLKYDYYASSPANAIFSEIYYDKGWQAYIDGQPADHFRADYILRGMSLPAGQHTVEFRFRLDNFDTVSNITLIFSLLILASLVAAAAAQVVCNRKKGQNAREQETAE